VSKCVYPALPEGSGQGGISLQFRVIVHHRICTGCEIEILFADSILFCTHSEDEVGECRRLRVIPPLNADCDVVGAAEGCHEFHCVIAEVRCLLICVRWNCGFEPSCSCQIARRMEAGLQDNTKAVPAKLRVSDILHSYVQQGIEHPCTDFT
jgi:hypothetical protein